MDRIFDTIIKHKVIFLVVLFLFFLILVFLSISNRENIPENCIEIATREGTVIECETGDETASSQFSDITDSLPIRRYNYEVSFITPEPTSPTIPILITVLPREFPVPSPNAEPNSQQYVQFLNYVREHRSAAIAEFKSLGFEDSRYDLYFAENYAIEEFNGAFIENL